MGAASADTGEAGNSLGGNSSCSPHGVRNWSAGRNLWRYWDRLGKGVSSGTVSGSTAVDVVAVFSNWTLAQGEVARSAYRSGEVSVWDSCVTTPLRRVRPV